MGRISEQKNNSKEHLRIRAEKTVYNFKYWIHLFKGNLHFFFQRPPINTKMHRRLFGAIASSKYYQMTNVWWLCCIIKTILKLENQKRIMQPILNLWLTQPTVICSSLQVNSSMWHHRAKITWMRVEGRGSTVKLLNLSRCSFNSINIF